MAEEQHATEDSGVFKKITREATRSVMIALLGVIIVSGGFFVLVWGEAQVNIATTIKHAPHLNMEAVPSGIAVTYTGALSFTDPASDPLLTGDYAYIRRHIQTCAWVETEKKKRSKNKLTYVKRWTADVPNSENFKTPGYDNPPPQLGSQLATARGLTVGEFGLVEINQILAPFALVPRKSEVKNARFADEQWAYMATDRQCHSTGGAAVGDQRVRFDVLRAGDTVTVFGRLGQSMFAPYRGQILMARGQRDNLIKLVNQQRKSQIWVYRACGSVLLWIGLYLIINPMLLMVSWIPIFGLLIKGAATTITMVIAVAVTAGFVFLGWGMSFFLDPGFP